MDDGMDGRRRDVGHDGHAGSRNGRDGHAGIWHVGTTTCAALAAHRAVLVEDFHPVNTVVFLGVGAALLTRHLCDRKEEGTAAATRQRATSSEAAAAEREA